MPEPLLRLFFLRGLPILIVLLVWVCSCQHPFFWDTVQLGARQALWYYDQRFQHFLLPDEIDSGHPSGFGMYLASIWLIFGKNLLSSHAAMLPFLLIILVGIFRLSKILAGYWCSYLPLLFVLDPIFQGQASLVSPDIVLLAFFISGLVGVLEKRFLILLLSALILATVSLRGMMAVLALYFFQISLLENQVVRKPKYWLRSIWPFVPAGLLAGIFLLYHAWVKTWVGFHADSPWGESFRVTGFNGLARNTLVLGWRISDYGRIFVLLILVVLIFRKGMNAKVRPYFILSLITLLIQLPHFLLLQGVNAHRYLLPFFLALILLFFSVLQQSQMLPLHKKYLLYLVMLGLASGSFWQYPGGIAQGWDSTVAHWPHFTQREELIDFLEQKHIPLAQVGTVFPEIGPLHWRDLSGREEGFVALNLQQNHYVYYSRVMNAFTDEEREELFRRWKPVFIRRRGGMETILFKKP